MSFVQFIRKPQNELEKGGRKMAPVTQNAAEQTVSCPNCRKQIALTSLRDASSVCECGYYFRMGARERIEFITDLGSFIELDKNASSQNILDFPGYDKKLEKAKASSGEQDAVICGEADINGEKCCLFVMEPGFMMGSMGTVVGEKITRLFEYATEKELPVVGYTVSGGARMQEGILSLMQMAKTSGAIGRHGAKELFYLCVLTDPTTGGVTASFAMEGDITLAEPGATIGFAGARVIEQTTREVLPDGFQKAEFLIEHGFVDAVVERYDQKEIVARLLRIHRGV